MGSGSSDGPGSGEAEKKSLIADIQASSLTPEDKQAYIQRVSSVVEGNNYNLTGDNNPNSAVGSRTLEEVSALRQQFTQVAQDREKLLLQNRAKLAAQLSALQATPGSKQTTNLTALAGNLSSTPNLLG